MFPGSEAALMDEGSASLPEAPAVDPLTPLIQRMGCQQRRAGSFEYTRGFHEISFKNN